ncbi:MAG: desulfoferrodoxin family protein [bacterium]
MKQRFKVLIGAFCVLAVSSVAWANKSKVEIEAPDKVKKGTEINVKLHVKHDSNSFLHYTDWVYLKVNGKEEKRWEYSNLDRPESAEFTVERQFTADKPLEIEAKAHCNSHGSQGPDTHTVELK